MVSFMGPSGVGKTTILVRLIKELERRKLRVAAIKHSRTRFTIDPKKKDSSRLRDAGAGAVLLMCPGSLALVSHHSGELSPRAAVERFFPGVDVVLVEGWAESDIPKIFVSGGRKPRGRASTIIAEIGKRGTVPSVPLFDPNDTVALADFIVGSRLSLRS